MTPESDPRAWAAAASTNTATLIARIKVPAGQLRGMATQGLLETALSYPLLVNYLLFNTPQEGIEALRGQCNALDEFLRRPDAAQVLLDLYESADLQQIAQTEEFATIQVGFVEILLAQPSILDTHGPDGRSDMVNAVVERWVQKQDEFNSDLYS